MSLKQLNYLRCYCSIVLRNDLHMSKKLVEINHISRTCEHKSLNDRCIINPNTSPRFVKANCTMRCDKLATNRSTKKMWTHQQNLYRVVVVKQHGRKPIFSHNTYTCIFIIFAPKSLFQYSKIPTYPRSYFVNGIGQWGWRVS